MHRAINPRYKNLESLLEDYKKRRPAIQKRLNDFRAVAQKDYFYELVYCFMTPQSSAVNSAKAQAMLMAHNFQNAEIDPEHLLHQKEYYIRFHKTKAKLLVVMKQQYDVILKKISNGEPAFEKRKWLAENVKGIGYKEATHFLRNVGLNDGLAILDRHILKNLKKHGAIRSLPKTLTKKKYLALEDRFQKFAKNIGIPIDELDLLFWSNETGEILK
jgi:N-glycosylase/DNA lyase